MEWSAVLRGSVFFWMNERSWGSVRCAERAALHGRNPVPFNECAAGSLDGPSCRIKLGKMDSIDASFKGGFEPRPPDYTGLSRFAHTRPRSERKKV